jgi:hypothetical protein
MKDATSPKNLQLTIKDGTTTHEQILPKESEGSHQVNTN